MGRASGCHEATREVLEGRAPQAFSSWCQSVSWPARSAKSSPPSVPDGVSSLERAAVDSITALVRCPSACSSPGVPSRPDALEVAGGFFHDVGNEGLTRLSIRRRHAQPVLAVIPGRLPHIAI